MAMNDSELWVQDGFVKHFPLVAEMSLCNRSLLVHRWPRVTRLCLCSKVLIGQLPMWAEITSLLRSMGSGGLV